MATDLSSLPFPKAFAKARASGVDTFEWQGSKFNTLYKEEAAAKKGEPQAMDMPELGPAPGPEAQPFGVLRSALDSIVRLDEKSPAMPRALLDVAEEFQAALETGGQRYGGARTPEADAYRHVVGSRNATLKAGVVPALAGGVGHELKNVVEAIRGNLDQAGLPKGAGLKSVAKNSLVDLANNLRGIMSAVRNPQELGEEEMMELLSAADLPPQG